MINYDILFKKKGDTMPKIKYTVKSKTISNDENYFDNKTVDSILDNNKIEYKENQTTVFFDYKKKTLRRFNDQIDMIHDFKDLKSNVHILELGRYIKDNIELVKYNIDKYNILIKYKVNDVEIEYKVEVLE